MRQILKTNIISHSLAVFLGALAVSSADEPGAVPAEAPKIPNLEVLDQDGETLRFYDDLIKDKIVAINFVFTTCPTICPMMLANFGQLQKTLQQSPELKGVHLISVTVDPVTDTPARLKLLREKFGAGDGWTFVTGDKNSIDTILKKFGVFSADKTDHPSFSLLGDDTNKTWKRVGSLAPPNTLARELEQLVVKNHAE